MEEEINKQHQVKETTNNLNPINRLGDYGVKGGPGRPKGSKNRFTLIKEELAEVWHEENGKEKFRSLFNGNPKDFLNALDRIISILPKDPLVKLEQPEAVHYTFSWGSSTEEK